MDLNRITVIGNVGQDPEYHDMRGDEQLCKFSLATTRKWKNKNSGEQQEQTQWHNVVIFNKYLVKLCKQFVQKGTRIFLEGESITRKYDKDGETRYINEVVVPSVKGELIVLARGKGWDTDNPRTSADNWQKEYDQAPRAGEELDDDIPF
jgi:single-strand DNA-binding protein